MGGLMTAFVLPLALLYFVFAVQLFRDTADSPDSKTKRSMRVVAIVFVFCGCCHLGMALGAPPVVLKAGYTALIVAMTYIVWTRQSSHFARALAALDSRDE